MGKYWLAAPPTVFSRSAFFASKEVSWFISLCVVIHWLYNQIQFHGGVCTTVDFSSSNTPINRRGEGGGLRGGRLPHFLVLFPETHQRKIISPLCVPVFSSPLF